MDKKLEKYVYDIDKHLKPLPTSERTDIVKEIKGTIIEMEHEHLGVEQIIERLGSPKDLAKAYLGNLPANWIGCSWNRIVTVCAFYGVIGFSGMVVIPILATVSFAFIACGILLPVLGTLKMINYILDFNLSFVNHIGINLPGIIELNPIVEFLAAIIIGVFMYIVGRKAWNLLICYCHTISKIKKDLSM